MKKRARELNGVELRIRVNAGDEEARAELERRKAALKGAVRPYWETDPVTT